MPFDSNDQNGLPILPKHNVQSFLTQAMAQNLQIQKQLMEQNQALQKLLNDQGGKKISSSSTTAPTQVASQSHNNQSSSSVGNSIPAPPPPPPMPAEQFLEGSRPFMDPYGRAKTVRIGKWRWPPRDQDVFLINNSSNNSNNSDTNVVEDEPSPPPVHHHSHSHHHNHNVPDIVVGKLRISNEMRAKLENVTGGNKNGNKKEIRKIEDERKNLLMEKLGGRALIAGQMESFSFIPPPPPVPVLDQDRNQIISELTSNINNKEANKLDHLERGGRGESNGMMIMGGNSNKQIMSMPMQIHASMHSQMHQPAHLVQERRREPHLGDTFCLTYGRVSWTLRLRKELLLPWENIEHDKKLLNLLYIQILNDMNSNTLRLTNSEKSKLRQLTSTTNSKLNIVQYTIKNTEFYFVVIFPVVILRSGDYFGGKYDGVTHVAVDLKFLKFVKKTDEGLVCIEARSLTSVKIRDSKIGESNVAIHEPYLSYLLNLTAFLNHQHHQQSAVSSPQIVHEMKAVPVEVEEIEGMPERKPNDDGKHSLLQFAMTYFRHMDKYAMDSSSDWTWKSLVSNVKYSPGMIQESLLQLDEANNQLALECYDALLCYMGDVQSDVSQVECVYTLLRNCHKSSKIIDELYCQLMKQTTNNSVTGLAGWRLFTIITAYFACSELLKPYLFKYLEVTAYDKRRNFHGTALVSLQNLRKTFKYGGRRNVPSVEEITALTAGRNAKRQIFRLPGGNDRVVNVRAATIVEDVLNELCSTLNIRSQHERQEFSLYCIVEGDTFTMPLQLEEYILDVTTELTKNNQVFYLIFCRSVWFYTLKLDNPLYVEVIFNQVAPDYLEGLLVVMQEERMTQAMVYDITRIAALLHRAADLIQPPTLKETKYLLPKPALAARDLKPNQWVQMVNSHWVDERIHELLPHEAKCGVLEILQTWPLFGSSFFTVKRINEPQPTTDYILALNKSGVHFLDIVTHETMSTWTYNQVISTRKVKNEDGVLYLDLKCGNLMQQRILRLETEHAHEISRLIRQYIHIQRLENTQAS